MVDGSATEPQLAAGMAVLGFRTQYVAASVEDQSELCKRADRAARDGLDFARLRGGSDNWHPTTPTSIRRAPGGRAGYTSE